MRRCPSGVSDRLQGAGEFPDSVCRTCFRRQFRDWFLVRIRKAVARRDFRQCFFQRFQGFSSRGDPDRRNNGMSLRDGDLMDFS
jgi:hypothetical protein